MSPPAALLNSLKDVNGTTHHARLLLGKTHPLWTDDVFDLLNKAADQAGWKIDYGRIDLISYWAPAGACKN
jgi:hypothetical protein